MYYAENFRPGTMENSGFHGKVVKSTRAFYMLHRQVSDILTKKDAPAYDTIIQAMSGMWKQILMPASALVLLRISVVLYSWNSEVLMAAKRAREGHVDIAMFDALEFLSMDRWHISRLGSHHNAWEIAIPTWRL